jgi:transcriptional regulator with XRE-family HTH domain
METLILKKEVEPMLVAMGKFIRLKRISLGLSQEELAARAGLHRTYISDVERGIRNLTIGAAWFVAHGLGVDFKEMINALDVHEETPKESTETAQPFTNFPEVPYSSSSAL